MGRWAQPLLALHGLVTHTFGEAGIEDEGILFPESYIAKSSVLTLQLLVVPKMPLQ